MSKLYASLWTDEQVVQYLEKNYVKSEKVKIIRRVDGGLDVDVAVKSSFDNPNEQKSLKNFLRKNGFTSRVGIHSRQRVDEPVRGESFKPTYMVAEEHMNKILKTMSKAMFDH